MSSQRSEGKLDDADSIAEAIRISEPPRQPFAAAMPPAAVPYDDVPELIEEHQGNHREEAEEDMEDGDWSDWKGNDDAAEEELGVDPAFCLFCSQQVPHNRRNAGTLHPLQCHVAVLLRYLGPYCSHT